MLKNTPPEQRDARDWPAIEAWAREVANQVDGGQCSGPRESLALGEQRPAGPRRALRK
jgi:hypothetical protein